MALFLAAAISYSLSSGPFFFSYFLSRFFSLKINFARKSVVVAAALVVATRGLLWLVIFFSEKVCVCVSVKVCSWVRTRSLLQSTQSTRGAPSQWPMGAYYRMKRQPHNTATHTHALHRGLTLIPTPPKGSSRQAGERERERAEGALSLKIKNNDGRTRTDTIGVIINRTL